MKKFLTAVLALVMIASMASVAAFAADDCTVAANVVEVEAGATTATVSFDVTTVGDRGIAATTILVTYPAELTIAEAGVNSGLSNILWGPTTNNPAKLVWVQGTSDKKEAFNLGTLTFNIPADAAVGTTYDIAVAIDDPENSFDLNDSNVPMTCVNGSIVIVEKAVDTETAVVTDPAADDTTAAPVADDTTAAPVADDTTTAPVADDTTTAKDKPAPQTGDMLVVVVAAMVVALGAAVVVKKVNVK